MNMPSKTIVIADDDPGYRRLLAELLEKHYDVVVLQDGREVLEHLRSSVPDMLILDVGMPFVSGIEINNRVKIISRLRHVPVLLITALGTSSSIVQACENGPPEGILHKPFSKTELLSMIGGMFSKKEAQA